MSRRLTKAIPFILLGLIFLVLIVLNLFFQDHWLDSDMAAEMIFSRLLAEENHVFATPKWYYSTEFRFLYTHLLMAPLFHITNNWHVIRTITNVVFYVLMTASYFYLMKPLGVSKQLTALTACILLLPFSETMMTHMQMGNTYMSHVILVLLFFGMFLRLVRTAGSSQAMQVSGKRRIKYSLLLACYVILALICGVSGVRYLLALQCPLGLAALFYLMKTEEFQAFRKQLTKENICALLKSEKSSYFYYSLLGAVGSVAGYGINVLWVSRQYVFQTYDATNFIAIYQGVLFERLQNAIGCLLMLFGYIPNKGFLSLRGIITLMAFMLLGVLSYCAVKVYQNSKGMRYFVTLFLVVAFWLNLFVFVFTTSTMVPRYYITIFIFALPVLAFYMEGKHLPFDKMMVGFLLVVGLFLGTTKTVFSFISVDKNENKRAVAQFLQENGYDFGYATYNNGNIITEITNGEVEIANISGPDSMSYFKWSSPMKYYEEDYCEGSVFLLLTVEEAAEFAECPALQKGQCIYEDGSYMVFAYESTETMLSYAKEE